MGMKIPSFPMSFWGRPDFGGGDFNEALFFWKVSSTLPLRGLPMRPVYSQWIFRVPVKGGRDYITPQKAKTISGIYVVFFLPIGGWIICHQPTTPLHPNLNNPLMTGVVGLASWMVPGSNNSIRSFIDLWIDVFFFPNS